MNVYTYSKARENLSSVLNEALEKGEVKIRRKDGQTFIITPEKSKKKSPLDVKGVKTNITLDDILTAVREGRERDYDVEK